MEEIEVLPVVVDDPGEDDFGWLKQFHRVPPGMLSWAQVMREFQHFDMALAPIRNGIRTVVERARERKCGKRP